MTPRKKRPQRKEPSRQSMIDHVEEAYFVLNQGELSDHFHDVDLDSLSFIELKNLYREAKEAYKSVMDIQQSFNFRINRIGV